MIPPAYPPADGQSPVAPTSPTTVWGAHPYATSGSTAPSTPAPTPAPEAPTDTGASRGRALAVATAIAALLAFIGSFLPYYSNVQVGVTVLGFSQNINVPTGANAWHGMYGWLGALLILFGGLALLTLLVKSVSVGGRVAAAVGAVAGTLIGCVLVAVSGFVDPSFQSMLQSAAAQQGINWSQFSQLVSVTVDFGRGAGFWMTMVLGVIAFILALCTLPSARKSGDAATPQTYFGATPHQTQPQQTPQPQAPAQTYPPQPFQPQAYQPGAPAQPYQPPYQPPTGQYTAPTSPYQPPSA